MHGYFLALHWTPGRNKKLFLEIVHTMFEFASVVLGMRRGRKPCEETYVMKLRKYSNVRTVFSMPFHVSKQVL